MQHTYSTCFTIHTIIHTTHNPHSKTTLTQQTHQTIVHFIETEEEKSSMISISASKDGWNRMPAAFNLHMSFADRNARETRQMGMAVMCSKAAPPT